MPPLTVGSVEQPREEEEDEAEREEREVHGAPRLEAGALVAETSEVAPEELREPELPPVGAGVANAEEGRAERVEEKKRSEAPAQAAGVAVAAESSVKVEERKPLETPALVDGAAEQEDAAPSPPSSLEEATDEAESDHGSPVDDNGSTATSSEAAEAETAELERQKEERRMAERLLAAQYEADRQASEAAERARREQQLEEEEQLQAAERDRQARREADERQLRLHMMEREKRETELRKLVEVKEWIAAKMFSYPEAPVAADSEVEVYFNRGISELKSRPNVLIMGAFNDWQWQPFRQAMERSTLDKDWWVCKLHIPKEAYILNFVFFDGDKTYENNSAQDFYLRVDGGLNEQQFEAFLADEKRRQAERAAAEEAERRRRALEEQRLAQQRKQQEAEQAMAKEHVKEMWEKGGPAFGQAAESQWGVWYSKPTPMEGGKRATLLYNRASRPLAYSQEVWLHAGVNGWQEGISIVLEMKQHSQEHGDWWSAEDGRPGDAKNWDNNSRQDFHARTLGPLTVKEHQAQAEQLLLRQLEEERKRLAEEKRNLEKRRTQLKEEMKQKTKAAFLQSQEHVIFTKPTEPLAGDKVEVYYNPHTTALAGKQEVWMRVDIPQDAYILDLVFSERGDGFEEGGLYDNRGGLDYHVPVTGSSASEAPLHIVHVALEMAPVAKVGGLGDVVTSLSRAVQELGHRVEVVLPKYDCLKYSQIFELEEKSFFFWGGTCIRTWQGFVEGILVNFLEPESGQFWVGCIYGRKDDAARFGFFCNAALEFLLQSGRRPDILHCHDWSSAPVAPLLVERYNQCGLANARTVFTIHNLEFGVPNIAAAMASANLATTVSPTYAAEISQHGAIKPYLEKFHGIRNGIDPDIWDPLGDDFIPMRYTAAEVVQGKAAAKEELRKRLSLRQEDRPIVGIITRLTAQKGIHLIKHSIWHTLNRGGQVVLLGSAPDPRIQNEFQGLASQLSRTHGDMARLWLTYDEPLSHLIYAASDIILVPSIFEPCGLTQLVAMRFGAVPVVRKTGGLNDTVFDVDHDKERAATQGLLPNGFSFEGADVAGVEYALNRALSAWYDDREWWQALAAQVMEQDWTWNRPALDYMELYHAARKGA
eukprot:SM000282S10603  [mRNA]  locus=s282:6677:12402:+ [translate_table: standard]